VTVTRVNKPWGYELHWAKTDRYVGKVLHINAGHALSLQYHNKKDETIYVHSGKMLFEIASTRVENGQTKTRLIILRHRERDNLSDNLGWR